MNRPSQLKPSGTMLTWARQHNNIWLCCDKYQSHAHCCVRTDWLDTAVDSRGIQINSIQIQFWEGCQKDVGNMSGTYNAKQRRTRCSSSVFSVSGAPPLRSTPYTDHASTLRRARPCPFRAAGPLSSSLAQVDGHGKWADAITSTDTNAVSTRLWCLHSDWFSDTTGRPRRPGRHKGFPHPRHWTPTRQLGAFGPCWSTLNDDVSHVIQHREGSRTNPQGPWCSHVDIIFVLLVVQTVALLPVAFSQLRPLEIPHKDALLSGFVRRGCAFTAQLWSTLQTCPESASTELPWSCPSRPTLDLPLHPHPGSAPPGLPGIFPLTDPPWIRHACSSGNCPCIATPASQPTHYESTSSGSQCKPRHDLRWTVESQGECITHSGSNKTLRSIAFNGLINDGGENTHNAEANE